MLLEKAHKTVEKFGMLSRGDRVVVAVSGGPDSVCLLSVLSALAPEWDLSLHVAHLDHMFRGEESAAEARFVLGLADKVGLPSTTGRVDVPAYCREHGFSPQEGARKARYDFLNRVSQELGAQRIAAGHTASDQAETFLMRLIRGAGTSGLSAIPPKRGNVIRPLIEVMRDEVLEYLERKGLAFVTDSSNVKPVYTRNRVRHELMPALKEFNPRIEETLATEAGLFRDEDEAMDACLETLAPAVVLRDGDTIRIKRDGFNALLPAFRRRLLRTAFSMVPGAEDVELSTVQTDESLGFMSEAQTGRALDLPGGFSLERKYDEFVLSVKTPPDEFTVGLPVPGVAALPGLSLEVETRVLDVSPDENAPPLAQKAASTNYLWQAAFDYAKISLPLVVRNRRPGDRFRPAGMGGKSKKLQDFFVDEKVPLRKRGSVPLLATDGEIVWVVGMRTNERFLPGSETKRVVVVRVWPSGARSRE